MNAMQLAQIAYARLIEVEAAHPDSPTVKALHKALNKARKKLGITMAMLSYTPEYITALDGGTEPPPDPQSGGGEKDDDDGGDD